MSLKPRSLYLAEGDFHVMPLFYLQGVEGRRRDLTPAISVLLHYPFARGELKRQRPDLSVPDLNDDREAVKGLVKLNLGQTPLAFSPHHPTLDGLVIEGTHLSPWGLVEEMTTDFEPPKQALPLAGMPVRWPADARAFARLEPLVQSLLPWYGVCWVNAGNTLMEARPDLAEACYQRALAVPGEKPEAKILFNLGRALSLRKKWALAEEAFQKSLKKDPGLQASQAALREIQGALKSAPASGGGQAWAESLKTADRLGHEAGKQKEALKLYNAVLAQGHFSALIWRNVGVLHAQLGEWAEADKAFQEGAKLDPKSAELVKMRALSLEKLGRNAESVEVIRQGALRTGDKELKGIVEKLDQQKGK